MQRHKGILDQGSIPVVPQVLVYSRLDDNRHFDFILDCRSGEPLFGIEI